MMRRPAAAALRCGLPAALGRHARNDRRDRRRSSAPWNDGSAAKTWVCGLGMAALVAASVSDVERAMPERRPPPEQGTIMASRG